MNAGTSFIKTNTNNKQAMGKILTVPRYNKH